MIRSHAELIVNDGIVFSAFEKFCKVKIRLYDDSI